MNLAIVAAVAIGPGIGCIRRDADLVDAVEGDALALVELIMKVFTPVTRYSAGTATSANPPIIAPFITKSIFPSGAAGPWPFRILK